MDEQRQQRIDEAARQFSDALVASYRAVSERGGAAQEPGAQLTQQFFNAVANNLRTQAADTRQMSGQLIEQQQRAGGHPGSHAGVGGRLHGFPQLHVHLLSRERRGRREVARPQASLLEGRGSVARGSGLDWWVFRDS